MILSFSRLIAAKNAAAKMRICIFMLSSYCAFIVPQHIAQAADFAASKGFLSLSATDTKSKENQSQPSKIAKPEIHKTEVSADGTMDLQDCYRLALLKSETLGIRESTLKAAEARYWQAVAGVFPKIHAIGVGEMQNYKAFQENVTTTGTKRTSDERGEFSINMQQPIFTGFRDFNAILGQKAGREALAEDLRRARQTLYLEVATVFYQTLIHESDLEAYRSLGKTLEERITDLESRLTLGKSRRADVLQSKAEWAEVAVAIEQTNGALAASRELCAFFTGLPAENICLKESLTLPTTVALSDFVMLSESRPDVSAAAHREREAQKQVSVAQGEHLPTVLLESNIYPNKFPNSDKEWNLLLKIDLPLFEGGATMAKIREKREGLRQSRLNLDYLRRSAKTDARVAYSNFTAMAAQVLRLRDLRSATELAYQSQLEDYEKGIATSLEVLDALRKRTEAARKLHTAEHSAKLNLIRLHVAAGKE